MLAQQCRPVQGCQYRITSEPRISQTNLKVNILYFRPCGVGRIGQRKLSAGSPSASCRRQRGRHPATIVSSSASVKSNSPSNISRSLRELAKANPFKHIDSQARADLDERINILASQYRAATANGNSSSSRELGSLIWSLAKLSTPCCFGHAVVLLRSLTTTPSSPSSTPLPADLRTASNQTLCKALYGVALLAREASTPASGGSAVGSAPQGPPCPPTPSESCWPTLLLPSAHILSTACVPRLASFNMQDVSSVWWAVGTLSVLPPTSAQSSSAVATAPGCRSGAHMQISTALCSQSRLQQPNAPGKKRRLQQLQQLQQRRQRLADEEILKDELGGMRDKGQFVPPAGLLSGLAAASVRHMRAPGDCSTHGLANMLWGACRASYMDERMLGAAVAHMTPQISSLVSADPRATATCLWALASLRYPAAEKLMTAASRPAAARLGSFDDQSLANLLWAYGTAGVSAPKLFSAAADELVRRADRMGIHFLAISLWSFATLNHFEPQLLAVLADALTTHSGTGEIHNLAKEAHAAAGRKRGGRQHGGRSTSGGGAMTTATMTAGLMAAEAALAERLAQSDGRRTQAVANLAWSYASLGARHDPLLSALAGRAAATVPAMDAHGVSNVLYSIARLGPYMNDTHPDVLEALLTEVDRRLGTAPTSSNHHNLQTTNQPRTSPRLEQFLSNETAILPTTEPSTPSPADLPHALPSNVGDSAISSTSVRLPPSHRLQPRDLAMIAWSVAILCPSSPRLWRLLQAAVAAAAPAAAAPSPTASGVHTDDDTTDVRGVNNDLAAATGEGKLQEEELQSQPYNLFGLAQLYSANYVACLAEVAAANAVADAAQSPGLPSLEEVGRETVVGGWAAGGSAVSVGLVVRTAAAAMRQAQRAAEAISSVARTPVTPSKAGSSSVTPSPAADGDESRTTGDDSAAAQTAVGATETAAASGGGGGDRGGQRGAGEEMVRFGPLAACPALFRACRDAWFLNTVSTEPSSLQADVVAVLRDARQRAAADGGSDGNGGSEGREKGDNSVAPRRNSKRVAVVEVLAEETLSPDRMMRVDLLVQYDGWLVLLEVDGPTHFAFELYNKQRWLDRSAGDSDVVSGEVGGAGAASSFWKNRSAGDDGDGGDGRNDDVSAASVVDDRLSGRGVDGGAVMGNLHGRKNPRPAQRQSGLRPLGDTVFRNRLLAASLGHIPGEELEGKENGGLPARLREADPWVVRALVEQLPSRFRETLEAQAGLEQGGGSGGDGSGGGLGPVLHVAVATLTFAEWNAAGPREKWAGCLAPLLARVCRATDG